MFPGKGRGCQAYCVGASCVPGFPGTWVLEVGTSLASPSVCAYSSGTMISPLPSDRPHSATTFPNAPCAPPAGPMVCRERIEFSASLATGHISLPHLGETEMTPGYLAVCLPHQWTPEVTQATGLSRKGLWLKNPRQAPVPQFPHL